MDEQFGRNLTHTLGAWLRTDLSVAPLSAEQHPFTYFAESTSGVSHVLPLRLDPAGVRCGLALDLKLAQAIVDLLLGGSGRVSGEAPELTEIEEAVLGSALDIILREWTTASQHLGLIYVQQERDRTGHSPRLMPLQEKTLCCRFRMTLPSMTGDLLFCLPSNIITSSLREVWARRELVRHSSAAERQQMVQRLRTVSVQTSLHFPAMRLSSHAIGAMQPGSLLRLPLPRNVPAELRTSGIAAYVAQAVASGEHRGAEIVRAADNLSTEKTH